MIGLKRGVVELADHDPAWEENATETIARLRTVLGDTAKGIAHVGSTSIRGIKAKPIIDIAVSVGSLEEIAPFVPELERRGFRLSHHSVENDMLFICGDFEADIRTHHIHVVPKDSAEWQDYLLFRDCLNANPGLAEQYAGLKLRLMERYKNDRAAYTDGKADFIRLTLRRAAAEAVLGRRVTVTVDRQLGSVHPRREDILYTVNYGYIAGVMGGDGHEQDAYILRVNEPVAEFTGVIVAVILREDDDEDKWVVAPEGVICNQTEVMAAVQFVERFFRTKVICQSNHSM